ncbi:MAG: hypothetical protein JWN05_18 [Arthrobacter sp.]|nr:hypothetical protein [Arthrobacter sp.]
MFTRENIDGLLSAGGNVLAVDGDKVGSIGHVYVDDDDGQPTWVTVKTGLFGTSESFVPLEGARTVGNDIRVAYTKDEVKGAPRMDVDGHLEPSEEDRLYEHYGLAGRTYSDMAGQERISATQEPTEPVKPATPMQAEPNKPAIQEPTAPGNPLRRNRRDGRAREFRPGRR